MSHLKPEGLAGVVLANGSLSSDQGGEASLRRRMVDAGVVECIVTLPAQLFYGTQIPACIWMMSPGPSDRRAPNPSGRTLFIDARTRGRSVDRVHAELTADDIAAIAGSYRRWRAAPETFRAIPGFAKSASLDEVRSHRYALVPGRYVGFARTREAERNGAASDVEIEAVRRRLEEAHAASSRFCAAIEAMKRG